MAIQNFVPKIWSTKILRTLEDNLVAKKICTSEYTGEVKKAGDTVYFSGLADPTINDYTGTITYETLQDAGLALIIDQQKYFAFKVGDVEKAQANIDAKGSQASRAAYKLKEVADSFILGKYADALHTITDATMDTATVLSTIGAVKQKLAEQNVSENDMWLVIPPWVKLKMQLAGIKFSINEGINGTGGMAWTKELGFDVYVTNQVVAAEDSTTDTPHHYCLGGAYNSIVYADQIVETEALRLENSFNDAVRGLHVYGAKVIKPDLLVKLDAKFAAETTI
jgi:hypothetical protein